MSELLHVELRNGAYADSVTLLQVSRAVQGLDGVLAAQVAMATGLNIEVLTEMGFDVPDAATPNDMVVALRLDEADALDRALDGYLAALHAVGPLGMSMHDVVGRIVELRTTPRAALAEQDATAERLPLRNKGHSHRRAAPGAPSKGATPTAATTGPPRSRPRGPRPRPCVAPTTACRWSPCPARARWWRRWTPSTPAAT